MCDHWAPQLKSTIEQRLPARPRQLLVYVLQIDLWLEAPQALLQKKANKRKIMIVRS